MSPPYPHANINGSDAPEKPNVRLGFVPLTDCAPLVAAKILGLGRRHGLNIELVRQPSWAAVRDKLLSGELDAAQALYGLVYGVQLGIGGPQADMAVLMTLNRNGQAITLSNRLSEGLRQGRSLRTQLAAQTHQPVFAQTFPTGTHAMWLYYWLAAEGLDPLRDVRSVVIPPPQMSDAMALEQLDGFCAGEPWHAVAEAENIGRTAVTSGEIWPDHPEKVLACRRDLVALYPNTARALTMTILEACRWLDAPEHRREMAGWLSGPGYIGRASNLIAPRMLGDYGRTSAHALPLRFFADGEVNHPYLSDGNWFLTQYVRWGMAASSVLDGHLAAEINQTALYRQAAAALDIATADSDTRSSVLIDGRRWDGSNLHAYARSFPIQHDAHAAGHKAK
ncbi:nitrate/nitrite transport system substrate-binding protein [Andreprevotia lacus DSM 23236]|uniref:Nitrate/nitrite transport system substrate-binding protein n=1 Tax=Andreprevotia lacus DSM 23236 TaxID=1121001 RepID=A0A1W1XG30_9NEIS|nr:CmpA/NrtA family ABC transporter substrate-binding protein [Andreprevotia lacus]SMC22946.1 nitrate/nitrite transport system substrate-binding protein [Andreprevotia lacus DSM 23236]